MDRVQFQIRWDGMVQGVGFRALVQSACRRHRVSGWVRNLTDGSVEALLVGEPADVESALEAVARARGSMIRSTDRRALEPGRLEIPNEFEIRR